VTAIRRSASAGARRGRKKADDTTNPGLALPEQTSSPESRLVDTATVPSTRRRKSIDDIFGAMGSRFISLDTQVTKYCPSGLWLIDWLLTEGRGLPMGGMVHLYSDEGAGKSHLLYKWLANAGQCCHGATLFDQEGALLGEDGRRYLTRLGVPESVRVGQALDQNVVFQFIADVCKYMIETGRTSEGYLIGVDSVASLCPALFDAKSGAQSVQFGDAEVATQARAFSTALKYLAVLTRVAGVTVVYVNQLRSVVNRGGMPQFGGKTEEPSGGKALRYYAHVNLKLSAGKTIYRKTADAADKKAYEKAESAPLGRFVSFYTEKNKFSSPFRRVVIPNMFGFGFDDVYGMVRFAETNKVLPVSNGRLQWNGKSFYVKELWARLSNPGNVAELEELKRTCGTYLSGLGMVDSSGNPLLESAVQAAQELAEQEAPETLDGTAGLGFSLPKVDGLDELVAEAEELE